MSFDGKLREYLTHLALPKRRTIDEGALRHHFLEGVRGLGARGEGVYRACSKHLTRLARWLERVADATVPVDSEAAFQWSCRFVDAWAALDDVPVIDSLEFERIGVTFDTSDTVDTIEKYALENRLARWDADALELTSTGDVFRRLWGREGVRWLLTVELAQSRGDRDPHRASRTLLELLLVKGEVKGLSDMADGPDEPPWFDFPSETLSRLVELDVLRKFFSGPPEDGGFVVAYLLNPGMKDVVQRALDPGPWPTMVAALLEDEHAAIVRHDERAVDAAVSTTRLIAHEVRNALIPVRHQIDTLGRDVGGQRLDVARRGVARVLDFVDQMVATSELVEEAARSVMLGQVVDEAIGQVDDDSRVDVIDADRVSLRVPRVRLARAIANLLRNALQADATGRIRVTVRRLERGARIEVDDAGQGVPPGERERIFDDGFTKRPGGTGFGLAYVRRVVHDLGGTVWCEPSDLGGARFLVALPDATS